MRPELSGWRRVASAAATIGRRSDVASIRELAGDADIRTTTIYIAVSDQRLEHAIEQRSIRSHGIRGAAA